jgi:8-oxo-dGTP pyrophosphatase MutT (NUDIX family)
MSDYKNPWRTLSEKKIYENDWIMLNEHQVINPNGNKGIYGKVSFKNKAIGIIPLDAHQYTWIVGQYRYTLDEFSWEIPMGGGPISVDILESAKRELLEETGLIAKKWTQILRIHTSNSVTDEEGFVFLAEDLFQSQPEFDDTEKIIIKKLPFSDVYDMVINNQITDSISIAGILRLGKTLGL